MHALIILLLFASINFVKAIIPVPRYNGGCAAVEQKLYCYGGTSNQLPTADQYVFDLTNDFSVGNSINMWNTVIPTGDFVVEPNSLFSIVPLNDSFIIRGGLGYASSTKFLKNTTIKYDTISNAWSSIVAMNQTSVIPSREETATLDPLNRIWIWGGISDNTSAINISQSIYHNDFQVLNLNNTSWSFPDNTTASSLPFFPRPRLAHSATLSRSETSIFYIGGLEADTSNQLASAPMDEILEYNITNGTWILHKSPTNSTIPSPRRLHSATLVPNSDLIFVYGGSLTDASEAVLDYSYLLNTTSFQWTAVNIQNTGAGPRFGHSAVLYKDNSLFIVFGADPLGNLRNDFFVMDITNWQWVTEFKANGIYPAASVNTGATTSAGLASVPTSTFSNQSSSANSSKQSDKINFKSTVYWMIGVMIFFMFM